MIRWLRKPTGSTEAGERREGIKRPGRDFGGRERETLKKRSS